MDIKHINYNKYNLINSIKPGWISIYRERTDLNKLSLISTLCVIVE